jgi:type IV secretion system protein VirB8
MNRHSRETLDAYYAEAASWNRDRVQAMSRSHRAAWVIAGAAALIAVLEAIALVLLMPLKTVEPYTLMVDRTTGYVQGLKPLEQSRIAPDAALTQSFLVQYVLAREGFDMATVNTSYRKVTLFSADAARSSYLQQMQVSNPQSPLLVYPRTTVIDAQVKSVSPIGRKTALVRFDTFRTDAGAQAKPIGSWVAVIRYRFSDAPMSVEDRFVNPLGFQVISYRRDPEALPAVASATAADGTGRSAVRPAQAAVYYPVQPQSAPPVGAGR